MTNTYSPGKPQLYNLDFLDRQVDSDSDSSYLV